MHAPPVSLEPGGQVPYAASRLSLVRRRDLLEALLFAAVSLVVTFPLAGLRITELPTGLGLVVRPGWPIFVAAVVLLARLFAIPLTGLISDALPARQWPQARLWQPIGKTLKENGRIVLLLAAGAAVLLPFLPFASRYVVDVATTVAIYVLLGLGINVIVGLAGLLNLGYAAFYAAGAYTLALGGQWLGFGFWTSLPLSIVAASLLGVAIGFPVLRLRGDYLAIVTLGFGEVVRILLLNLDHITGGPSGISGVPKITFFGLPFAASAQGGQTTFHMFFGLPFSGDHRVIFLYEITFVAAALCAGFVARLRKLAIGRAWEALREDEFACQAIGINPTSAKLTAMAIGCGIGGLAGCLFAARQGFISPESFTFGESALALAIVVLGGLGSQFGVLVAALVLVGIPELFRELSDYRLLAFGAALVLVMIWRPRGLAGARKPTIEI